MTGNFFERLAEVASAHAGDTCLLLPDGSEVSYSNLYDEVGRYAAGALVEASAGALSSSPPQAIRPSSGSAASRTTQAGRRAFGRDTVME